MNDLSVLIKPVSAACNMKCEYCFYRDETINRDTADFGKMSAETAELIVKKATASARRSCTFMFQGGEPTLAGIDFYRFFLELENKYARPGFVFRNAIQTNGFAINDEWASFLSENRFLVGLSLDGTSDIHNRYRKASDGKDTFNSVLRASRFLDKYKVEYNILCVITGSSAGNAEKIYNFFRKMHFTYLQFIPCLEPLRSTRGSAPFALSVDGYGDFLIRIFRLWLADLKKGRYISIRHIDNYLRLIKGLPPECCSMNGHCAVQCVTEADGSVYPCDFYVLDEYRLGDIQTGTYEDFFSSERASSFIAASAVLPEECKNCGIVSICRNGCRRDRTNENKNYYCKAYQRFFTQCGRELAAAADILVR